MRKFRIERMLKVEAAGKHSKVFLFKRESRSKVARVHGRTNLTDLRWEWLEHFWRKEKHNEGTGTHRKCQGPEYRQGFPFKREWFSAHVLLQNSLGIPDIFKATGTIGFIFTNATFPLSELFWNKFIWRKKK